MVSRSTDPSLGHPAWRSWRVEVSFRSVETLYPCMARLQRLVKSWEWSDSASFDTLAKMQKCPYCRDQAFSQTPLTIQKISFSRRRYDPWSVTYQRRMWSSHSYQTLIERQYRVVIFTLSTDAPVSTVRDRREPRLCWFGKANIVRSVPLNWNSTNYLRN